MLQNTSHVNFTVDAVFIMSFGAVKAKSAFVDELGQEIFAGAFVAARSIFPARLQIAKRRTQCQTTDKLPNDTQNATRQKISPNHSRDDTMKKERYCRFQAILICEKILIQGVSTITDKPGDYLYIISTLF